MKFSKLEQFISQPRLDRFLLACGNSKSRAQRLYKANLRVSQAAYPLLNLFEIFLRNSLNTSVQTYFGDADWIINQKGQFMSHQSLQRSRFGLRKSVESAERTLQNKGTAITAGKVIAEQTFGFWTSLFEPHHFRLIGGSPLTCFSGKPSAENRSSIAAKLNDIRKFRNRVYHNEPICFQHNAIDFVHVQLIIQNMYDLLNWIDGDLANYISEFDNVDAKINIGMTI